MRSLRRRPLKGARHAAGSAALLACCVALPLGIGPAGAAVTERLCRLDGSEIAGPVEGVDAQGQVRLAGGATLPLEDLLLIERAGATAAAGPGAMAVQLIDGSRIQAASVIVAAERSAAIRWRGDQVLHLPLAALRAVIPARTEMAEAIAAAVAMAPAHQDQLLALTAEGTQAVPGTLVGMDAEGATIAWQGRDRRLAWARIGAVTLGQVAPAPERRGRARLDLADRSSLWARIDGLEAGQLRLHLAGDAAVTLPWAEVLRLELASARVVYCSDLEPVEAEAGSWVGTASWQRDRSALEGPLVLGGRSFIKGLGTKAPCRLVYDCPAGASHFAATVGIDDAAGVQGDCVLRILGDGKELATRRVRAKEKPVALRVGLAGVRRVELRAEPGENLDLGDHADWCDARFDLTGNGR